MAGEALGCEWVCRRGAGCLPFFRIDKARRSSCCTIPARSAGFKPLRPLRPPLPPRLPRPPRPLNPPVEACLIGCASTPRVARGRGWVGACEWGWDRSKSSNPISSSSVSQWWFGRGGPLCLKDWAIFKHYTSSWVSNINQLIFSFIRVLNLRTCGNKWRRKLQ